MNVEIGKHKIIILFWKYVIRLCSFNSGINQNQTFLLDFHRPAAFVCSAGSNIVCKTTPLPPGSSLPIIVLIYRLHITNGAFAHSLSTVCTVCPCGSTNQYIYWERQEDVFIHPAIVGTVNLLIWDRECRDVSCTNYSMYCLIVPLHKPTPWNASSAQNALARHFWGINISYHQRWFQIIIIRLWMDHGSCFLWVYTKF
jgi:hypothetical protein